MLIPEKGQFHVLTSVPLEHTKAQYDLYKVISLPVPVTEHKAIQHLTESPYIAITQDKRSYVMLNDEEAAQYHYDTYDYCPLNSPSYDTGLKTTCILSLFLKETTLIKPNCQTKILLTSIVPILKHISDSTWLSSFIRSYNIEVPYNNKNDVIGVAKGIQVIELNQGFDAYSS